MGLDIMLFPHKSQPDMEKLPDKHFTSAGFRHSMRTSTEVDVSMLDEVNKELDR